MKKQQSVMYIKQESQFIFLVVAVFLLSPVFIFLNSCSKGGVNTTPPNPCTGVTITVSAIVVNPIIGSSNGSITATASGSSGFTFNINGGTFQSSGNFTGLAAGSYTIIAKTADGCSGSATFTLTGQNPCSGITITVSGGLTNPTSSSANNGSITASASGGTSPYMFSLNGGTFQSSNLFSNLGAGSFTLMASDANNCTGSVVIVLTVINPCSGLTITVAGTITNPTSGSANNGSITASASGGTSPYMFSLNGGTFQSSNVFNNLGAGNFTITGRDANNCTGSAVFTLTAPNPCAGVTITVSSNTTQQVPCVTTNGSITINATGGTGPYTFSLNGGTFQTSNVFNNLTAGNYTLAARDVNNCNGNGNATVSTATAGPLFLQVKNLIQANCAISGCHAGTQSPDLRVDCNIINNRSLIQQRAVNGVPSAMPPSGLLSPSERQKITDWINAGGQFNN